MKVLVIDDAQTMRLGAKQTIESSGHEAILAEGGISGLVAARKFAPDLILLDIVMPDLDGYSVAAMMRATPALKKTPIYMMSGNGGVFDVARAEFAGFTGSIIKPFKQEALREIIASVAAAEA